MKKFILIPDSFKGTLSSQEVCNIIENEIIKQYPDASIIKIPVADGGEGSVDAFLEAVGGTKVFTNVKGPYFENMVSFYGLIDNNQTAVIEMSACAGLPLVGNNKNPSRTTTYGVGELIIHAINNGVKKIIIGLGGSSTNDAGCGCAAALGVKFYDKFNQSFIPVGGSLHEIVDIDMSTLVKEVRDIEFVTMCDIDNPLYGLEGAAHIFGPQKGADPQMVLKLDENLQYFSRVVEEKLQFREWDFKGAGAAGGMGYGMRIFLNSKIQMGIETVLDITNFDNIITDADYIITGEGRLDYQSMRGKVVIGVARRAKRQHKRVIAIVGSVGKGYEDAYNEGVNDIVITNYKNLSFEEVKLRAKEDLKTVTAKFIENL